MQVVRVKRLWNNIASVRDYIVKRTLDKHDTLKIYHGKRSMTIPYDEIDMRSFMTNKHRFPSKKGTPPYYLIDFKWQSDLPKNENNFNNGI